MPVINYQSPFGMLNLIEDSELLTRIEFVQEKSISKQNDGSALLKETSRQLDAYFAGKLKVFSLPLKCSGTEFQQICWEQLKKIPWGKTVTYGFLADLIESPKASRAVGLACSKNPIPIIIPCHRVIGKNGSLTGFAWGVGIKKLLLKLEGVMV